MIAMGKATLGIATSNRVYGTKRSSDRDRDGKGRFGYCDFWLLVGSTRTTPWPSRWERPLWGIATFSRVMVGFADRVKIAMGKATLGIATSGMKRVVASKYRNRDGKGHFGYPTLNQLGLVGLALLLASAGLAAVRRPPGLKPENHGGRLDRNSLLGRQGRDCGSCRSAES